MTCPKCKSPSKVIDNTRIPDDNELYRKRRCRDCGLIFYTTEFIVEPDALYRKLWTEFNRANSKNRKRRKEMHKS